MGASAEKSQTVESFCSASSSNLDGVCWQERARQLVAEVPEERETKLAEFRERIALLAEELEGLAESKLLKEESFLVRFFFLNRTMQDNIVLISGFYEAATGTWTLPQA